MAVFRYTGIVASSDKEVLGVLDAESEREARRLLKQKDIYPITLQMTHLRTAPKPSPAFSWRRFARGRHRPNKDEIIIFTRQLAGLIGAGFSVVDALKSVEEQLRSAVARTMIVDIRNAVVEGQALSNAMTLYPAAFSSVYCNLIQAGEASGSLDIVLERMATIMERQQKLHGRLISAMLYPLVLLATGTGVVFFLVSVVVPKITVLFINSRQALPAVTRSLIAMTDFLDRWGVLLAAIVLLCCVAFSFWLKSRSGRKRIEELLLAMPVIGAFCRQIIALRLCQTLAMLLSSDVAVLKSIEVAAGTTGFVVVEDALKQVARGVGQGEGLAQALQQTGLVPDIAIRMIHTGEQAGTLENMLDRIYQMYDTNLQRATERLMNLFEPLIVILLGAVVAYVVVAVLMPIFEMNRLIR